MDTGIHGYMDTEIQGYMDTGIHGYMDTEIHDNMDTGIHGYMDTEIHDYMDTGIQGYMIWVHYHWYSRYIYYFCYLFTLPDNLQKINIHK